MNLSKRMFFGIIGAAFAFGTGVLIFNLIPVAGTARDSVLCFEAFVGAIAIAWHLKKAIQRGFDPHSDSEVGSTCRRESTNRIIFIYAGFAIIWSVLFSQRWQGLEVYSDDHHYLAMSKDWPTTWRNLLRPHNEHLVAPQRLFGGLVVKAGHVVGLENAMQLGGTLLFVVAIAQLHLLAATEYRSQTAGALAVALFAFTTSYYEVMTWYTASLWLIPLNLLLTGMLVARKSRGAGGAAAMGTIAFLGCFSFSIGMVIGPLLAIWALSGPRRCSHGTLAIRVAAPLVGVTAAMTFIVPAMLRWFETDEYLGNSSREALKMFDPIGGVANTVRVIVDFLLLRNLGVPFALEDWRLYALSFPLIPAALVWLLQRRPESWRLFSLWAFVLAPYALVYPFRSFVTYDTLQMWNRYHLIPQMGLALFLAGVVCVVCPQWIYRPDEPDRRQVVGLLGLATVLTLISKTLGIV